MRFHLPAIVVLCLARPVRAAEPQPDPSKLDALTAEVEQLKAEVDALKRENASLKEKLATAKPATAPVGTTRPSADLPATQFELGPAAQLGSYKYSAPVGWTLVPPKENKLSALYRSPDRLHVIYVQVKPKGAAPPEMQPKYAQSVIQLLKQDFVKSKTEVLEPPTVQKDGRFFLKVRERIRTKGDKTADQTHLYMMPGKDMLELSVITTAEASDQVAAVQKLAEDLLLSFAPGK